MLSKYRRLAGIGSRHSFVLGCPVEFWFVCNSMMDKGGFTMKSNNALIGLSILFFVFAVVFSVLFWADVPLAAKIGLFVLGFVSGMMGGQWFVRRRV
jgi:hypothetical protein